RQRPSTDLPPRPSHQRSRTERPGYRTKSHQTLAGHDAQTPTFLQDWATNDQRAEVRASTLRTISWRFGRDGQVVAYFTDRATSDPDEATRAAGCTILNAQRDRSGRNSKVIRGSVPQKLNSCCRRPLMLEARPGGLDLVDGGHLRDPQRSQVA